MRRRRAALVLNLVLAVLLAACGSGVWSSKLCPPQVVAAGSVTPAQARSSVVEVTACPAHPSAQDPCYASTGWAIGNGYVVTAGHVIANGPLGPYLASGAEPPTIRRADLHVVVDGHAPTPATALTVEVQKSDLALLRVSDLKLPGLPVASQAAAAGTPAAVVCDAATLQHLSPPPPADTFTGTATAVQTIQGPGPPRVLDVTGSGTPPGCSGAPVIDGGQVVGSLFAGSGNGQPGSGDASVIPIQDVLSVLHLNSLTAACASLPSATPAAFQHVGSVLWVVDDGSEEHVRVASDTAQAREVTTLPEGTLPLDAAVHTLAAVYPDGTLHLIDLESGGNRAMPATARVDPRGAAFNLAGSELAVAESSGLEIVDVASGHVRSVPASVSGAFPERWSANGLVVASTRAGADYAVTRIDTTTGADLASTLLSTGMGNQTSRNGLAGGDTQHQPSPGDAEMEFLGDQPPTNTVRYYRLGQAPSTVYQELQPDDDLSVLAVSPDGSLLLVRSRQRMSNDQPLWKPQGVRLVTSAGATNAIDPDTETWDYTAGDFAGTIPVAGGTTGPQAQLHALVGGSLAILDRVTPATSVLLVRVLGA